MMRYRVWAAVSRKDQAQPDRISLKNQVDRGHEVGNGRGWRETGAPFIVRGESRTIYINLIDAENEIPELRDMLNAAQRGEFDILVAYDTNRFRNLCMQVFNALSDYRIQIFFISQPVEPVPPENYDPAAADTTRMIINAGQLTSDSELSQINRRYRSGMRGRVMDKGLPIHIPWGYRRPPGREYATVREFRQVVPEPDPSLAIHIIKIKDMFFDGKSIRQLIDYLISENVHPPRGDIWHPQTVRDILRNPFYAGYVRFEVSQVIRDRRAGRIKRNRKIPIEKIKINIGKHIPLWDNATHQAILMEMHRRTKNFKGRTNNQFTGLLKCGECDASLWRWKNGSRSVPDRLIWRCSSNPSDHVAIHHIDLLDKISHALQTSLRPALEDMQSNVSVKDRAEETRNQVEELQHQRKRLEDAYQRGLLGIESFETRVLEIDEKIQAAQVEASTAQYTAAQRIAWIASVLSSVDTITDNIYRWMTTREPGQINQMLHNLLDEIIVRPAGDDYSILLVYKR